MALEKQMMVLQVGSLGADAGKEPRGAPGVARLENAEWSIDGVVGKRIGSTRLEQNSACPFIAEYRDRPVSWGAIDAVRPGDSDAYAFGSINLLDVDQISISQFSRSAYYYCDAAQSATIRAVAYISKDTAGTYTALLETYDLEGGAQISYATPFTGYTLPRFCRVVLCGTSLHYYYFDESKHLYHGTIDSFGAISAAAQITEAHDALSTSIEFDVCALTGYVMVAYAGDSSGRLCLLSLPSGTGGGAAATLDIALTGAVSKPAVWSQTATNCTVACVTDNTTWRLSAGTYQADLTQVYAPAELAAISKATYPSVHSVVGVATSDTSSYCYWSPVNATSIPFVFVAIISAGTVSSAGVFRGRARIATKPMRSTLVASGHFMGLYSRSWGYALGAQDVMVIVNKFAAPCGKAFAGTFRSGDAYGHIPTGQQISAGEWLTAAMWIVALDNSVDLKDVYQVSAVRISENITSSIGVAAGRERLLISGSMGYDLAGTVLTEHGFLQYPEPFTLAGHTTGGSMADGAYRYKICYEQTDSNGIRIQSTPSPEYGTVTITGGSGSGSVTLTIPLCTLTMRSNVQLAVYRTVKDIGTDYYRVGTTSNGQASDVTTFTDVQSDATIVDMDTLYTDSGEIENSPPRPHRVSCIWGTRHVVVDRDSESTDIYYSKAFGPRSAVDHSDLLKISCSPSGGRITAIAGFQDKLIIFKRSMIYACEGAGYDAALGGANFSTPWLVNPAVGCTDARCVALTPMGLAFLATDHQIYLLDHSLQCTIMSGPVDYWLDTLTPVALVAEPSRRLLHCLTSTYDMVFDWALQRWSIWTARGATNACSVSGVLHWTGLYNYVWKNDPTVWADNGERYATTVETTWISSAGLAGMQRLYRIMVIGYNIAAHGLRVKIAYDGDPTWVDSVLYSSSVLLPFDVSAHFGAGLGETYRGQAYCVEVFPSQPVCSSFRLSISDESGTGNTWSIAALGFLIGAKPSKIQRVQNSRVA